jgi:transcriptional regulator with XRE-family HTH domain
MATQTRMSRLPALIKAKRREMGIGLRTAAEESGVSPSTLSRLERGISESLPDTETLTKVSDWLGVSLENLLAQDKSSDVFDEPQLSTTEAIEVYLRADKNLTPETAKALSDMFKIIYKQFTEKTEN